MLIDTTRCLPHWDTRFLTHCAEDDTALDTDYWYPTILYLPNCEQAIHTNTRQWLCDLSPEALEQNLQAKFLTAPKPNTNSRGFEP